jgi:beta-phosphoglucomutase
VLWDLDGTLVDSGDAHWLAWHGTMAAEGLSIDYEQFLASFGQRNDRILRGWLGEDVSEETVRRIGDAKEAAYRRLAADHGLTPLPGAVDWIDRLRRQGWRQAIASSAPRLNVEVVLRILSLDSLFDAITAAEDVTIGKPDPQVFLTAAAVLATPASRCVVVEDAAAGIEAARRAGMRSIGVSCTVSVGGDVSVSSLSELPSDAFERLIAS